MSLRSTFVPYFINIFENKWQEDIVRFQMEWHIYSNLGFLDHTNQHFKEMNILKLQDVYLPAANIYLDV